MRALRAEFISPAESNVQTCSVKQTIFYKIHTRGPGVNSAGERNWPRSNKHSLISTSPMYFPYFGA